MSLLVLKIKLSHFAALGSAFRKRFLLPLNTVKYSNPIPALIPTTFCPYLDAFCSLTPSIPAKEDIESGRSRAIFCNAFTPLLTNKKQNSLPRESGLQHSEKSYKPELLPFRSSLVASELTRCINPSHYHFAKKRRRVLYKISCTILNFHCYRDVNCVDSSCRRSLEGRSKIFEDCWIAVFPLSLFLAH